MHPIITDTYFCFEWIHTCASEDVMNVPTRKTIWGSILASKSSLFPLVFVKENLNSCRHGIRITHWPRLREQTEARTSSFFGDPTPPPPPPAPLQTPSCCCWWWVGIATSDYFKPRARNSLLARSRLFVQRFFIYLRYGNRTIAHPSPRCPRAKYIFFLFPFLALVGKLACSELQSSSQWPW